MKALASSLLVVVGFLVVTADVVAGDAEKIQGEWKVTRAFKGVREMPDEIRERLTVRFDKDQFVINDGKRDEIAKFSIDESKSPKNFDFVPARNKEKTVECIYELKGNTLKLKWRMKGGGRPTEFGNSDDAGILELIRSDKTN